MSSGEPGHGEPGHGESALSVRDMVLKHDGAIDDLVAWRNELKGAFKLMQVALGTSIVSAIVSMAALVVMLGTGTR